MLEASFQTFQHVFHRSPFHRQIEPGSTFDQSRLTALSESLLSRVERRDDEKGSCERPFARHCDATSLLRTTKWTSMENGGAFAGLEELQTVSQDLMQQIREKMREGLDPKAFYDDVMHFVHSVRWSEPWLIGLISMEILLATVVVTTRKRLNAQTFLFFLIFVMVYWAENINTFLDRHWKKFATQAYFDRTGLFLSVMYSGPMLLMMIFIIINNLIQMVKMMVKVKRMELRHKAIHANKKKDKKRE